MVTSGKQRRYLRGLAHSLRPIVQVGQRGVTDQVIRQVETGLVDHELIKVKLGTECPTDLGSVAANLALRTGGTLAGSIGKVLILYRPHPEKPRIQLPISAQESQAPAGGDEQEATNGEL